ncbi:MAG: OmpH family outer membrane protein [Saprospiraceae bacterium]
MNTLIRLLLVLLVLVVIFISQYYLIKYYSPKIAYVRSDKLLSEYIGMKESRDAFTKKQMVWQGNIDSLKSDILKIKASKETSQEKVQLMEQNLTKYIDKINELAQEEDIKTTETVYLQINTYIEEYGKKKGYSIIFGSGTSGTLLYGDPAIDITEELLDELNYNYKPNHAK